MPNRDADIKAFYNGTTYDYPVDIPQMEVGDDGLIELAKDVDLSTDTPNWWIRDDFGVGNLSGDYEMKGEVLWNWTGGPGNVPIASLLGISDKDTTVDGQFDGSKGNHVLMVGQALYIFSFNGGDALTLSASITLAASVDRWFKLTRVGTSVTLILYSDEYVTDIATTTLNNVNVEANQYAYLPTQAGAGAANVRVFADPTYFADMQITIGGQTYTYDFDPVTGGLTVLNFEHTSMRGTARGIGRRSA